MQFVFLFREYLHCLGVVHNVITGVVRKECFVLKVLRSVRMENGDSVQPFDEKLGRRLMISCGSLNLTLQGGLLSQQFRVEYWKRGHLAWSHPYLPNCHYVGHLQHQPHSSSVALSNCNGLVSATVLLLETVLSLK